MVNQVYRNQEGERKGRDEANSIVQMINKALDTM